MSRNFLDYLKALLEKGYTIKGVMLSCSKTDTPALLISIEGDSNLAMPACPIGEIPEVKEFIKLNYPDVPFKVR